MRHSDRCCYGSRCGLWGAFLLGISILSLGVILVLHNCGVIDGHLLAPYWPVLIMIVGLSRLVRPADRRCVAWGLWWIAVGTIILLDNLGVVAVGIWDLWPMILVIIGGSLMFRPIRRRMSGVDDSAAVFDATAILGGVHRRISAEDFEGGDATAILGGCEIDLRESGAAGGTAEINAVAFWGGVEIRVPQDWEVQVRGTAILTDGTKIPVSRSGYARLRDLL